MEIPQIRHSAIQRDTVLDPAPQGMGAPQAKESRLRKVDLSGSFSSRFTERYIEPI